MKGRGCIIGQGCLVGVGGSVNTCKQCQKQWPGGALTVGLVRGHEIVYFGGSKPIWDVLALQGEREEAGEHLQGAKFVELFPIRQVVSGGSLWTLGLGLTVGYIVLVLSTYKHT